MVLLEPLAKARGVFVGMLLVSVGSSAIVNTSCDFVIVENGLCVCAPEMLVTAGMVQDV